ncbi:hypothetical protein Tco_0894644 [Tanacetum coccineum]|uniref:Uncharacterized protein n=1 Tax=Tanacetum coccineum TaxID=301880 RepID=A0ABQ5CF55_9ASTR
MTRYSWANLKDISKDFQGNLESFLLINLEYVEVVMLVYAIPELMHIHFRDISSDEKCRISWSECKCIQNKLKCFFFWFQSTRDSSIAFSNVKSILFGNKFKKVKLSLLSSDGNHDSAKSCHISLITRNIYNTKRQSRFKTVDARHGLQQGIGKQIQGN